MSKHHQPIKMTDAQKLIAAMLADLARPTDKRELEHEEIIGAITSGRTWSLRWKYHYLFEDHEDHPEKVTQVVKNFDMWRFIERATASWDASQKADYESQVKEYDHDPKYHGYDGNYDPEYGIAQHMVENLGRWSEFSGRDHNSHMPTANKYALMEATFRPLLPTLTNRNLSPSEVANIVNSGRIN